MGMILYHCVCHVTLQEVLELKQLAEEQVEVGDTDNQPVAPQIVVPPAAGQAGQPGNKPDVADQLPPIAVQEAADNDGANYKQFDLGLKNGLSEGQKVNDADEKLVGLSEKEQHVNDEDLDLNKMLRENNVQEFDTLPEEKAVMVDGRGKREAGGKVEKEQVGEEVVALKEVGAEKREEVVSVRELDELGKEDIARKVRDLKTVASGKLTDYIRS